MIRSCRLVITSDESEVPSKLKQPERVFVISNDTKDLSVAKNSQPSTDSGSMRGLVTNGRA